MANFSEVKLKENAEIRELRKLRKWPETSEGIGLALSGGGIRSATFNLGVLQGLATFKLLPRFDYMSTVSGGGYIGSWLISWIKRAGINEVERALAAAPPRNAPPPQNPSASAYVEPKPINFLRDYSNYLTPRVGLLGADTWAAATMIARNLLLNLAIVVCFLAALLLLPHFVQLGFQYLSRCEWTIWRARSSSTPPPWHN